MRAVGWGVEWHFQSPAPQSHTLHARDVGRGTRQHMKPPTHLQPWASGHSAASTTRRTSVSHRSACWWSSASGKGNPSSAIKLAAPAAPQRSVRSVRPRQSLPEVLCGVSALGVGWPGALAASVYNACTLSAPPTSLHASPATQPRNSRPHPTPPPRRLCHLRRHRASSSSLGAPGCSMTVRSRSSTMHPSACSPSTHRREAMGGL